MKNHEVVAKTKGKEVGRKTISLVENLKEAVSLHGEETVVTLVNQAFVTNTRNSMAKPAAGGAKLAASYAVYKRCLEGKLPKAHALTISGLTAEKVTEMETAPKV